MNDEVPIRADRLVWYMRQTAQTCRFDYVIQAEADEASRALMNLSQRITETCFSELPDGDVIRVPRTAFRSSRHLHDWAVRKYSHSPIPQRAYAVSMAAGS